jgi:hypothetical protein
MIRRPRASAPRPDLTPGTQITWTSGGVVVWGKVVDPPTWHLKRRQYVVRLSYKTVVDDPRHEPTADAQATHAPIRDRNAQVPVTQVEPWPRPQALRATGRSAVLAAGTEPISAVDAHRAAIAEQRRVLAEQAAQHRAASA